MSIFPAWNQSVKKFLEIHAQGSGVSVPGGDKTLYGSVYGFLSRWYLYEVEEPSAELKALVRSAQDAESGYFVGPELRGVQIDSGAKHDLAHLTQHSTSTVLPFVQDFRLQIGELIDARRFCDLDILENWFNSISWEDAWFEGNNVLFVGQFLHYLYHEEKVEDASLALEKWFALLEASLDPATSLWGTDGKCSPAAAVYGGYHQLLVYWYLGKDVQNPEGLVDTVLSLQSVDGGFNPEGNAGACEDVDSVDILVNCYKRYDYRRPEIRVALELCVDHILSTQNEDGGFPYNKDKPQSHMGIPGTSAGPNVSCIFPTWFRIHTLALCAEIIPESKHFSGVSFRFNKGLGMGWHSSPLGWTLSVDKEQREREAAVRVKWDCKKSRAERLKPFLRILDRGDKVYRRIRGKVISLLKSS